MGQNRAIEHGIWCSGCRATFKTRTPIEDIDSDIEFSIPGADPCAIRSRLERQARSNPSFLIIAGGAKGYRNSSESLSRKQI